MSFPEHPVPGEWFVGVQEEFRYPELRGQRVHGALGHDDHQGVHGARVQLENS